MPEQWSSLPSLAILREAVQIYLDAAYPAGAPAAAVSRLPAWLIGDNTHVEPDEVAVWLGSDAVERDPHGASPSDARAISIRLGNSAYPHMKLRMARPPRTDALLFSVDSHDGFLTARAEADAAPLEELKRHNAELARAIQSRWADAGIPTEIGWLRSKVAEAQRRRE
jgi:hypothetical protein